MRSAARTRSSSHPSSRSARTRSSRSRASAAGSSGAPVSASRSATAPRSPARSRSRTSPTARSAVGTSATGSPSRATDAGSRRARSASSSATPSTSSACTGSRPGRSSTTSARSACSRRTGSRASASPGGTCRSPASGATTCCSSASPTTDVVPPHEPVPTGDRPGLLARLAIDTRPLRHRDFRNLWIGQAISTLGGQIGTVAVPFQLYELTHSTLAVGMLGLAALVPLLVVPLWGGAIADALDRRTVLLRTATGMTLVTGLFLGNALLPHPQVWALFVLESIAVGIYSLGWPAMQSLTPRLVAEHEFAAASAVSSIYQSFAAVAGPAAGGVLIAAIG